MLITTIFQTSDSEWHLQIYREESFDVQVLKLWSFKRLIEAIDMASALQLHVDNINALPISQYALQGFKEPISLEAHEHSN